MTLSRFRPAIGVGLIGMLLAGSAVGTPAAAAVAAPVREAGSPAPSEESAAQLAARRSGIPVEVLGRRTETSEVFANGDGTFTWRQHLRPVRALVGGSWKATDATLHRTADGTVVPGVTTYGMTFSGGGTAPLAVLVKGGGQVALTWPGALPAPVLDGTTATYPEVLPGVDLRLIADVDSFAEYLVVKDRAAAADPALGELRFGVQPHGLDLAGGADGGLRVVDPVGDTVFSVPQPRQWDASAARPEVRMATQVSGHTLRITPDRAMLTDSATTFPVVIDPTFPSGYKNHWAVAYKSSSCSSCAGTAYYDGTTKVGSESPPEARVGHESDTGGTARALFQMNIDGLHGSRIISATFNVVNTYSYSCTKEPVELWSTGAISSSTTWNNQPSWSVKLQTKSFAHGYSSGCTAAGEDFTSSALAGVVQSAADKSATNLTLGLRTTDETNTYTWKRFKVNSTNPVLEVTYNHAPTVDSATAYRGTWTNTAADQPLACAADPASGPVVGLGGTTLTAAVGDADKQTLTTTFTVTEYGGATVAVRTSTVSSGSTASATLSVGAGAGELVDGHSYVWSASTSDGTDTSATTTSCGFTVDGIAPTTPVVTATDGYALDVGQVPARQARTVKFTAADTRLSGFCYALNQTLSVGGAVCAGGTWVAAGADGSATVTIVPPRWPANTLTVVAYDAGTNTSVNDGSNTVTVATKPAVFVSDNGSAGVADRRGDFTGDGQVDLMSTSSAGAVYVYPGKGTGALDNAQPVATGFAGALIAHGGDFVGPDSGLGLDGYEDLVARPADNNLYIYPGDGLGHVLGARRQYTHPGGTTWAAATQLAAPGDIDGYLGNDLLTVEGDSLLLYSGTAQGGLATDSTGAVRSPRVLAGGWTGWDLLVPGDITGDGVVDVLGRKHTDTNTDADYGKLYLFAGVLGGDGTYGLAARAVYGASGFAPAGVPLLGGAGNAQGTVVATQFQPTTGAGTPDFWATAPGGTAGTGQLFFYPGTPTAPGTAVKVGDGQWTTSVTRIS
jgi:hypothetical protein